MSQVQQSAGLRRAVSASTAPTKKTSRSTRPPVGAKTLPFPPLSFITDQRSRVPKRCWFDVPAQDYGRGNLTGAHCYADFMKAIEAGQRFSRSDVLKAVFAALDDPIQGPSRRGAAATFVGLLLGLLQGAAKALDFRAQAAEELAVCREMQADYERRELKRKATFSARMQAAKRAKADARGVSHG